MAQRKQMDAYDYRGHVIVVMPSGLAMVFLKLAGAVERPMQLLGEVYSLEEAKAMVDARPGL